MRSQASAAPTIDQIDFYDDKYRQIKYHGVVPDERRKPRNDGPATGLEDPRCDVAGLRVFVGVARTGSVSRAARELGRTQPAVSARLAALEAAWDTRLFRRGRRGMTPTPEGARLLPQAERALRELGALDRAAGVGGPASDELRVGAGDALGRSLLPLALAELLRERPGLEVRLREGPGPRLLEALRDGEIDLALLLRPADRGAGDGVSREPLFASRIEWLSPETASARRRRALPVDAVRGRLVTLQPGSEFRRHVEGAFRGAGVAFAPAVEVGNLSLVVRFVAAGLGSAAFPAIAWGARDASEPIARRPLSGLAPLRYEWAVRERTPPGAAAARLLEILRQRGPGRVP